MTERFPIRVLSESTGVGSSTLRAWERRYGLLNPERTPKGHRLYRADDIERIERIIRLLEEGHSLPSIAKQLDNSELSSGAGDTQSIELIGVWRGYLADTLQAIEDFSSERLEAIYNEASSLYPLSLVTEQLIQPVLVELGSRWQSRAVGIAEEHFYTHWIRNRLAARFHHALEQATGKRVLCASIPGDFHEIGLMLFCISLMSRGYRVVYLGVDIPMEQLIETRERSGCRAIVLSARSLSEKNLSQPLAKLVSESPVPVFFGGPASDTGLPEIEQAGGIRLGSKIEVAARVFSSHVPQQHVTAENSIPRRLSL